MLSGRTKSGFEFEIDPDLLDDMEFIDLLAEASDNGLLLPKILVFILGEEQKKALYEHLRGKNGKVSRAKVDETAGEIIEFLNTSDATKN